MLRRQFSLTGNSEVVLLTSRFYETSNPCFDGKVPWAVALGTCYFLVHSSSYTFLSYNPCPILATWALSENTYRPQKKHGIQKIPWFSPLFLTEKRSTSWIICVKHPIWGTNPQLTSACRSSLKCRSARRKTSIDAWQQKSPLVVWTVCELWYCNCSMAISRTDWLEVPTIYKAYFSGLCKGISPQKIALYGTVPPF